MFERVTLEAFQSGLSWLVILRKRERFREVFAGFDPEVVGGYDEDDVIRLLADPGIVRNRLKVAAATRNAQAFLAVQQEFGSFDRYVWSFVGGAPLRRPRPTTLSEVPVTTPESDALSRDLKRRGFAFVGSTICYAFMQSVGMVDDHVRGCFRAT
jgi:DNA-3-methyladenine glycosylase I